MTQAFKVQGNFDWLSRARSLVRCATENSKFSLAEYKLQQCSRIFCQLRRRGSTASYLYVRMLLHENRLTHIVSSSEAGYSLKAALSFTVALPSKSSIASACVRVFCIGTLEAVRE